MNDSRTQLRYINRKKIKKKNISKIGDVLSDFRAILAKIYKKKRNLFIWAEIKS